MRTLDIIDTEFLRASSPIWTSRARTRERASGRGELFSLALLLPAPRFRVSSRVPLARLLFTICPKWRAFLQANFLWDRLILKVSYAEKN